MQEIGRHVFPLSPAMSYQLICNITAISVTDVDMGIFDNHIVDSVGRQRLATLTQQEVLHLACWPDLQVVPNSSAGLGIERNASGLIPLASSYIELAGTLTQGEIIEAERRQFSSTHHCMIEQSDHDPFPGGNGSIFHSTLLS